MLERQQVGALAPSHDSPDELPSPSQLNRRLVATQSLFSAGHSLTTGGFFNYFASSFHPSTTWLAILQAAPEFFETAGVWARPIVMRWCSRKTLWRTGLVLGRIAALGIPLTAILCQGSDSTLVFWGFLISIGIWYALQGLSYVAFLSWLSDLTPEPVWGRTLGTRQAAAVACSFGIALITGPLIREVRKTWPADQQFWFYVIAFTLGGGLAIASTLPMFRLPDIPVRRVFKRQAIWAPVRAAFADRSYRAFLTWAVHMAFAQGLTQAVLTSYQIRILKIPLEGYLQMQAAMLVIQIILSLLAGRLSDRFGDRNLLFFSHLLTGLALVFPFLATPEAPYWQFGAYLTWGLFGIVNVSMATLMWRLAPRSDNTSAIGLVRPLSGMTAALAGIAGGVWLDALLKTSSSGSPTEAGWTPYHVVFAVSLVGRLTAPFWLLLIPASAARSSTETALNSPLQSPD